MRTTIYNITGTQGATAETGDPWAAYQAGLQNMPWDPATDEEAVAYTAGLQNMPYQPPLPG